MHPMSAINAMTSLMSNRGELPHFHIHVGMYTPLPPHFKITRHMPAQAVD